MTSGETFFWQLMPVQTARFLVRPIEISDRAEFVRVLATSRELHDPWSPLRPENTDDNWLFERQWEQQVRGECVKLVAFAADGRIAAFANLNNIARGVSESANAGWSVNAEFAGQGAATETVTAMLDIAFAPAPRGLGLHRVACGVMPENHRSLRVAEKCGFRREGFAPELIKIAGKWRDHVLFAKLADEHRTDR